MGKETIMKTSKIASDNINSTAIIEKWYKLLEFPTEFDNEFYSCLHSNEILENTCVENFDFNSTNGKINLLSFLFMCEKVKTIYQQKNIPENVLLDTLKDIVNWTKVYSKIKNSLYLGEIAWLKRHMTARLFRLGRLQFAFGVCPIDYPKFNLKKGDNVVEVHIPEGEKICVESCERSFSLAKEFFDKYFPNYDYTCFACESWLLDKKLNNYLDSNSNIVKFASRFEVIEEQASNSIIKYLFSWDTTMENLNEKNCTSTFAQKIKNAVLNGEQFHECFGVFKK